jgi:hypothetical protein
MTLFVSLILVCWTLGLIGASIRPRPCVRCQKLWRMNRRLVTLLRAVPVPLRPEMPAELSDRDRHE